MSLLKKIFENRRARQIRRAREKYFDMFVKNRLAMELSDIDFYRIQDAADEVVTWLYKGH